MRGLVSSLTFAVVASCAARHAKPVEGLDIDEVPDRVDLRLGIHLNWTKTALEIHITGPKISGFKYGMVSRDKDWDGEDCLGETSPTCHVFAGDSGRLRYVTAPVHVRPGRTTLFDGEPGETHILYVTGGECFVWGADPFYYSSQGCNVMGPDSGRRHEEE